jgi:threonylcarbamoyladenosine tRNA methylthiotransferase MtaB
MKISLVTLGCKTNQTDAASLAAELTVQGHEIVSSPKKADALIVHTCTVTQKTDYQARQAIRQAIAKNPEAKVVVTGCYAQVSPRALEAIPGVDFIVGMGERNRIPDLLQFREKQNSPRILASEARRLVSFAEERVPLFQERTRAYLKVQDGCNSFCSYCIVPFARGRNRSLPLDRARARALELSSSGFKEIVLTGIHLGTYGTDLNPPLSLLDLLQALERAPGMPRIRLSSIEPAELTLPFIDFLSRGQNICPHLHIPLQSGDDDILRRMNRNYSRDFFSDRIHRLVQAIPDLTIGVDLIGGFPGEDEQAFENTCNLVARLPLAYLHVFPFSRREGTPAAKFPDLVPSGVIKARCRTLRDLGARKRGEFYRSFIGRRLKVLIESKRDRETALLKGFSRNYIPVLIAGGEEWIHQELEVQVTEVRDEKVFGIQI